MTWQLRRAGADDIDRIMELETGIFVNDAWSRRNMLAEVTSSNCYYLVAFRPETPDVLGGYAGLLAPRGGRQGDVQTIAVAPEYRRQGLGRLLMLALLTEARQRGVTELFLEVRADNPHAENLYASLGFARLGVRPGYYQPDNVDAVVMRLQVPEARTEWASANPSEAEGQNP
jgi:ribosomal-protein-alanine N-acetyltransferase